MNLKNPIDVVDKNNLFSQNYVIGTLIVEKIIV